MTASRKAANRTNHCRARPRLRTAEKVLLLIAYLAAGPAEAQDNPSTYPGDRFDCGATGIQIEISVQNIDAGRGQIVADLHDSDPAHFLKRFIGKVFVPANAPIVKFCMTVSAPGDYAIALYQDKNSDRRLDKGALGIPSEPIGFSNNPRIKLAPPSYQQAAFHVGAEGTRLIINLRRVP